MADNSQILREYLLSLGFKVNTTEQKKFVDGIEGIGKRAALAGTALVGIGIAAEAMVQSFASSMEKLYYASKRTDTSVSQLQAFGFAAGQIGLNGDAMQGAIENMAKALRNNPGLTALLKSLGVKVEGRTNADHVRDLVKQLSDMPFYVARNFASMFGISDDQLLAVQMFGEEFDKAVKKREDMNTLVGLDPEAAAKAGVEFKRQLNDLMALAGVLKDSLMVALVGPFTQAVSKASELLVDLAKLTNQTETWGQAFTNIRKTLGFGDITAPHVVHTDPSKGGGNNFLNADAMNTLQGWRKKILDWNSGNTGPGGGGAASSTSAAPPPASDSTQQAFNALEDQYGLPHGLLDSLWAQESSRGKNLKSPTGVIGQFQINGDNRKRLGVTDPMNVLMEADAAAEMMFENLQTTRGDMKRALALWNGGTTASRDIRLGTDETKAFVPSMMSRMATYNTFHIQAKDAKDTAKQIGTVLDAQNAKHLQDVTTVTR